VVVEFSDSGHLADPLTGRLVPSLEQEGGRGVYLVNQLCDLVQLRSSPQGTTVRVLTWL
jgi:anti-sigma regulatory factor (Ser/Thr protein kinase)